MQKNAMIKHCSLFFGKRATPVRKRILGGRNSTASFNRAGPPTRAERTSTTHRQTPRARLALRIADHAALVAKDFLNSP
jgi:hypothetical protein